MNAFRIAKNTFKLTLFIPITILVIAVGFITAPDWDMYVEMLETYFS